MRYLNKFSENQDLTDYINGKLRLTPIMNILMNDRTKEWYSLIGEYFYKKVGDQYLGEFYDSEWKCRDHKQMLDRIKSGSKKDKIDSYRLLGIFFITSYLNEYTLKEMFGNPICHSEFGEGFHKDDEETDPILIRKQLSRSHQYCSYFVDINGYKVHIGYDHRGTSIEIEINLSPEKVYETIKNIIDMVTIPSYTQVIGYSYH